MLAKQKTAIYSDVSSEDGDNERREREAKQELDELDRMYFIDEDNMNGTDGFL